VSSTSSAPVITPRPSLLLVGLLFVLLAFAALVTLIAPLSTPRNLSAPEADDYVGTSATVCDTVTNIRYVGSLEGRTASLMFENDDFAVFIPDPSKFQKLPDYKDKKVCITGKITENWGRAEIVTNDPRQISLARSWNW